MSLCWIRLFIRHPSNFFFSNRNMYYTHWWASTLKWPSTHSETHVPRLHCSERGPDDAAHQSLHGWFCEADANGTPHPGSGSGHLQRSQCPRHGSHRPGGGQGLRRWGEGFSGWPVQESSRARGAGRTDIPAAAQQGYSAGQLLRHSMEKTGPGTTSRNQHWSL